MKNAWNIWLSLQLAKFLRYDLDIAMVLTHEIDSKHKADKAAPLEQTSVKYIDVILLVWSQIQHAKNYTAYTCHESRWTVWQSISVSTIWPQYTHLSTDLGSWFLGKTNNIILGPSSKFNMARGSTRSKEKPWKHRQRPDKTLERNCSWFNKKIKIIDIFLCKITDKFSL